MLYPYHLSDMMVRGLCCTPFNYYVTMVESIMLQERSYDALPNFTAADCEKIIFHDFIIFKLFFKIHL